MHFGKYASWKFSFDEEICLFLSFLFGFFAISLEGPKLYKIPGREISLSIHDWTIFWNFWDRSHFWSSTTPKYKQGWFNIPDFFLGQAKYSTETLETKPVSIQMPEKSYLAIASLQKCSWKRPRWPTPKIRTMVEITPDIPIPTPGDATYSWSGPAANIEEGVGEFIKSTEKLRYRKGGCSWKPE